MNQFNIINQSSSFIELIFKEEPTLQDLTLILTVLGLFWGIFFAVTIPILWNHFKTKPWIRQVSDRDYERYGKELLEKIGILETPDEYFQRFQYEYPWWWCVCVQHFVSGILCFPSISSGLLRQESASSLACLGILSEIAFEISDIILFLKRRYYTPNGKVLVPIELLGVIVFHHSLSILLGLPMIIYYRNFKSLHWLCFSLQAAAGVAATSQQITKSLDVTCRQQHRLFLQLSGFTLITMTVTRVIHWPILVYQVVLRWYDDKAWIFMGIGIPIAIMFTFFNLFLCIQPGIERMIKFWNFKPTTTKEL